MPSLEDITIVVPTRNEARNIGRFLRSVPTRAELIVVDKSDDETRELVARLRPERTKVLYSRGTLTEAREIGAREAKTPWLLFTDADVVFADDYFEQLGRVPDCDVAYGPKLSLGPYRRYYAWCARGQWLVDRFGLPCASGSNLLVRARAFDAAGGFDLRLRCNEDSELVWRIKMHGGRCRFDRRLVVWAIDHRRLERGVWRKTLHTLARCFLLRLDLLPERSRSHDWGYWREEPPTPEQRPDARETPTRPSLS